MLNTEWSTNSSAALQLKLVIYFCWDRRQVFHSDRLWKPFKCLANLLHRKPATFGAAADQMNNSKCLPTQFAQFIQARRWDKIEDRITWKTNFGNSDIFQHHKPIFLMSLISNLQKKSQFQLQARPIDHTKPLVIDNYSRCSWSSFHIHLSHSVSALACLHVTKWLVRSISWFVRICVHRKETR